MLAILGQLPAAFRGLVAHGFDIGPIGGGNDFLRLMTKDLEQENARLKRPLADSEFDKAILR